MWKWIVALLAVALLYKLLTADKTRKAGDEGKAKERRIASGELVKDPVCGVYVEAASSISVRDGDRVQYFCGHDCRDRFLKKLEAEGRPIPRADDGENDE
ncbi:MAG: transcriptional regulator [Desulfovibrio sp.]|nr:transcriptional regulator [Desulfovibrio sp.]